MGRPNIITPLATLQKQVKLRMERLKWVDGDYDQGGAYWGCPGRGMYMYCAWGKDAQDNLIQIFVCSINRADAKQAVKEKLANATFYR